MNFWLADIGESSTHGASNANNFYSDADFRIGERFSGTPSEREFFIDSLLVRIHFIIVMIRWTGLAPWEFELPFPGSLPSTFL